MSFVKLNKSTGGKTDVNADQVEEFYANTNPAGEADGTTIVFAGNSRAITVKESAQAVRSPFRKAQQPLKPVAASAEPETEA